MADMMTEARTREAAGTDQPATETVTRILGFVPLQGLDALLDALAAVPGPAPRARAGQAFAALLQAEPEGALLTPDKKAIVSRLLTVQRRLEIACQAGPFLPVDPAAACCPMAAVADLLDSERYAVGMALRHYGLQQQWDIVLRWTPETVVARNREAIAAAAPGGRQALADAVAAALLGTRNRREAALLNALAPAVLALAAGGAACTETEVTVTVLVTAGGDAAVEAALDGLPAEHTEGAELDMRGPLPPLNFAAVRLASAEPDAIRQAWAAMQLPGTTDRAALHRTWRKLAAGAHPDRQPAARGATVAALTDAYNLLRGLFPAEAPVTLDALLRRGGTRLVAPAVAAESAPRLEAVP